VLWWCYDYYWNASLIFISIALQVAGKIKRRTARRVIEILKIKLLVVSIVAYVFYFFTEKVDQFDHSLAIPISEFEKYGNRCPAMKRRHSNIQ